MGRIVGRLGVEGDPIHRSLKIRLAYGAGVLAGAGLISALASQVLPPRATEWRFLAGQIAVFQETRESGWLAEDAGGEFFLPTADPDSPRTARTRVYCFRGNLSDLNKLARSELKRHQGSEIAESVYRGKDWSLEFLNGGFDPKTRIFQPREGFVSVILCNHREEGPVGKSWRWVRSKLP